MKKILMTLSIILLFIGCSDETLTNKKAKKIINDYLMIQPLYETHSFLSGEQVRVFEEDFKKLQEVAKGGYISIRINDTIPTGNLGNMIGCDLNIEEKGKPYVAKTLTTALPIQDRPIVNMFRCELDSIKEIKFIDAYPGIYARVLTRFRITDKTPFSVFYKDTTYIDKAISLTCNDGVWSFNNYID